MFRSLTRVILFALSLAVLPRVRAEEPIATSGPAPTLTLEECITGALKKNFDLQIQGFSTDIARESLNIAKTDLDPTFTASANRGVNQAAASTSTLDGTTLVGQRLDNTSGSIGVSQKLGPTGATIGLSADVNRAETNSSFSTLNPAYGSGIIATISQPLLKGAGSRVAHANIDRSKLGLDIANLNFKASVLLVVRNTETAYFNLVSARETLRIRQLSLELAQKLLDENRTRRTTGVATDLDVLSAEVGVSNANRAVLQAEQTVNDSEDTLLSLMNTGNFNARPGLVTFGDYTGGTPSFAASYKRALDNQPDYLATEAAIKQYEIDLAVAKQNRLPSLNLDGSLGYNATDRSYGDALNNLPTDHGNSWSLGLTYVMPWGQRADYAHYRSTMASLNQQKARLAQIEQSLVVQVRAAVRAVDTNLASVDIAAKSTELSAKQYELEKARFDAGLSTSRLVLQAQDDLQSARLDELNAKITLRTAVAELHRLEGSSLERYKIAIAQ